MNDGLSRGHPDPTANIAIANVMREAKAEKRRYRPIVYICSPFAGDTEGNIRNARGYCRFAVATGHIPLAPHLLYPQFMDDADAGERELGLRFALIWLSKCEELWVFGSSVSSGMEQELAKARRRKMAIRHFDEQCREARI